MKILHLTKKYPYAIGGDAAVVMNLENQQQRLGNEVLIVTPNCTEIIDKLNVIKFGIRDNAANWDNITLKRIASTIILFFLSFTIIKKNKPDIVHSHSADLGFIFSFACRLNRVPIINQCHGVSFPYKHIPYLKRIIEVFCLKYSQFNKIITVDLKALPLFQQMGIKNVEFINNGVDCEQFNLIKENKANDKVTFLFVGRLDKLKGLDYLLAGIGILAKTKDNFIVNIMGNGVEEAHLKETVKDYKIDKYVNFLGGKDSQDIIPYYKNADIFILPSLQEGFPITLLEAWAACLPVIITEVGSVPEICTDNENALIIPPGDPQKIAEAMKLLSEGEDLRAKLGEKGHKMVEDKYCWTKVAEEYGLLYQELVAL